MNQAKVLQQLHTRIKPYVQLWLPYWRSVLLGILCLLVTNALAVWIPWEMKSVLDRFATKGHLEAEMQGKLLWVAGLCGLMMLIRILSRMFLLGLGRWVEHDLRDGLYAKCLSVPVSFFHTYPPGEVMSRMTNDVMALRYLSGGGVMLFTNTLLAYISSLPMMWLLSPRLTVYAFLIYPVGIWLMKRLSLGVKRYYGQVQETLGQLSQLAQESFSGVATIQGYGKQTEELKRFELGCETYLGQYKGLIRQRVWLYMVVLATSGASLCLVLLEGGGETIQHRLTLPGFLAFTLYLERLSWPTMTLGWTLSLFQQGAASLQRIHEILETPGGVQAEILQAGLENAGASKADEPSLSHQIRLQSLSFGYTPEQPILKDITTTLPATGLVVVVGPIGSGKSTLLRLLPKLYSVERGQLFYGGQDSADIPVAEIRHQIAYMGQQSFLFSESVANNMTYGRPQIAELLAEERQGILDAYGQLVSLHEDILDMPEGYDTSVGERGLLVSGGQRQRLALARALMREAPILVLDDPFSHLDVATEEMILNGLVARKVFQNRLTIVATHRFAIASQADRVLLLDHGQLIAEGTHETLLKTIPLYQQLHRLSELEVACLNP